MHDCASILDSIAKGIVLLRGYPCFHDFLHGASLHPYSMIFHIFFRVAYI